MMFMCPYCKTLNGVSAHNISRMDDFDTWKIICAKCGHDYYVRKMVEYVIDPPIKEEVKQ